MRNLVDQLDAGTGVGFALTDLEFFRIRNQIAASYIPPPDVIENWREHVLTRNQAESDIRFDYADEVCTRQYGMWYMEFLERAGAKRDVNGVWNFR